MTNVLYRYEGSNYSIAVIPVGEQFDVRFMFRDREWSTSIEVCNSKSHAIHGAEHFPEYYELALQYDYKLHHLEFVHPDGRTVDLTCAMDMDRTKESFELLLINGEEVNPMIG